MSKCSQCGSEIPEDDMAGAGDMRNMFKAFGRANNPINDMLIGLANAWKCDRCGDWLCTECTPKNPRGVREAPHPECGGTFRAP